MTGATEETGLPALDAVREAIGKAARIAGRHAEAITLIAISKTHDERAIRPLLEAGQRHFGENRVQEAQTKWPALKADYPDVVLHLVGQLQSNKAADAVALFDVIHSVDRPSLVSALVKAASAQGHEPVCFVQVNIGDEPQKGGCAIDDVPDLIAMVRKAPELSLAGLMCVPPADVESAPYFALLAKLARENDVTGLSMGMSGDYETAVMLGATHVRVGTALFGERNYSA
ncbi:MAG: YggS family pyridoxal phosphate-dependent enzyme [Sphingobium sp.]